MPEKRTYHTETAGQLLVARVPHAAPDDRAGATLSRVQGHPFDYAGAVYLVAPDGTFAGVVPMTRLLAAKSETPLRELHVAAVPTVHAGTDQERVATLAIHHGLPAVPVLDRAGALLGVVPPEVLLEVLRHEHVEDLHRLAGIRHETTRARTAIEAPPLRRARDRLPWLLAGLAGSVLATAVMASFEEALRAQVAIAFFVPAIVYLADAVGTQTEAVAVRGISLSHAPLARLVWGEVRTGALIGSTLGALAFLGIWTWLGDARLAAAVALSLLVASAVATTIGFAFPYALARTGRDPAYGSGPIATIIQDVFSLLVYFTIVAILVR
jgi:magnesium transporter